MLPEIRVLAIGMVALSFLSACSHVEKNTDSFYSRVCSDPEGLPSGVYDAEFDLISTSHGSMIYFELCPEKFFGVDLSIVMPRDKLDSDFAQAIYRNAEDPYTVLKIDGKVEYKFVRTREIIGGEVMIRSMEKWEKASIDPSVLQ